MQLKSVDLFGFKSFAKKTSLQFQAPITAIVGPNGSGKSNIAEAFRFVLGEQSMKSMRGRRGEDLIWNGSTSSPRAGRGGVKIVFDNRKKIFDVDFDEVSIERVVHRDGINEYSVNGTQVRLRDIFELLAKANVGSSGHHIISQGESDHILSANARERREMIEDALGLKIYHYKRDESIKKLGKTRENITHVESLRKEIAPHLRFLEKQVERVEKAKGMREDLKGRYREYLKRESLYLARAKKDLLDSREGPMRKLGEVTKELEHAKQTLAASKESDGKSREILALEEKLSSVRQKKEEFSRRAGQIEGELRAEERRIQAEKSIGDEARAVPLSDIRTLLDEARGYLRDAVGAEDLGAARKFIASVQDLFSSFLSRRPGASPIDESVLSELTEKRREVERELAETKKSETSLTERYRALESELEAAETRGRDAERKVFELMNQETTVRSALAGVEQKEAMLAREEDDFKREVAEGAVLVGRDLLDYETLALSGSEAGDEDRNTQEERRRGLEKLKIRLEEFGGGSSEEVLKEHGEVKGRDEFLAREILDLNTSAASLTQLIDELTEELKREFQGGLKKINEEFEKFFRLMFGGGSASLSVVVERRRKRPADELEMEGVAEEEEEQEPEEGIEIRVSLPHKRIKGLEMLSGGERALTSIALIFAMSQVNPPPFLILDETDAALDEANSRRYGDMIENLSKKSQLILITHNRETMSRAGILYGITMGGDGISKLLSVKFEEAVAAAK